MIRVAKHLLRNDQSPIKSSGIVVSRVTDGQQCQTTSHCGVRRNVGFADCFEKVDILKKWIFRKSGYFKKVNISKKWIFQKCGYFKKVDILIKKLIKNNV